MQLFSAEHSDVTPRLTLSCTYVPRYQKKTHDVHGGTCYHEFKNKAINPWKQFQSELLIIVREILRSALPPSRGDQVASGLSSERHDGEWPRGQ